MFWGLLGSRHVQTSLENIVLRSRLELKIAFTSRQLQQHYVFCYAVGLCGWVSVFDATCIIFINMVPSRNPSKVVVVSHCISTRLPKPGARAIGAASTECLNQHAPKKTAATTRFHWTFGGLLIGLASLAIRS